MTTTVTITGSGTPIVVPGQAGPGVLVQSGDVAIQIDVGRGTTMRLADIGLPLTDLTAVCITHHHSDHLVGLADLLMSRWIDGGADQLPVVAPTGEATNIARRVLEPWTAEMAMRRDHRQYPGEPTAEVLGFDPSDLPTEVFEAGGVRVLASSVEHEPVLPAVGYRIETADGVVAISGDTRVCDALANLARGAAVFVCEAFRLEGTEGLISDAQALSAYHADSEAIGRLAAEAEVDTLILTHLIPPVRSPNDKLAFEADARSGGFEGQVVVASDLDHVTF